MKRAVITMIISIFMISACSPVQSPEAGQAKSVEGNQVAYGLLGPGPINYGVIRDDKDEYAYDGYINTSPSFRTLDRHRHDFGDDQDKIRAILLGEEGVDPGAIYIVGKDVWVYAKVDSLEKRTVQAKEKELEHILEKALQRYDVHVQINQ